MKKVAEIMQELGFRPEGSNEVKKAFIKNLINQASLQERRQHFEEKTNSVEEHESKVTETDEQLSLFTEKKSS